MAVATVHPENHCRKIGSDYLLFSDHGRHGRVLDSLAPELRQAMQNVEMKLPKLVKIKDSRSTLAGLISLDGTDYFVKRHNARNFFHRFRRWFQKPRPICNLEAMLKVAELGIVTPRVYLAMRTRHWLLPGHDYLITEAFPAPLTAADFFPQLDARRENTIRELAALLAKIHAGGMYHSDAKLVNILCRRTENETFEFGLFDFDGSRLFSSPLKEKLRRKELARIISSYLLCGASCGIVLDPAAITRMFVDEYQKNTGINSAGTHLNERILFLIRRTGRKVRNV